MIPPIIALFRSTYSYGGKSLLTLDEPGRAKSGTPLSVFDLSQEVNLKEVFLIDDRIDGYINACKIATKLDIKLSFGIRLTVCANMADQDPESRRTESKVIIMVEDNDGYKDLIKILNRSWGHQGSFTHRDDTYGRADWKLLKEFWTDKLILGLPYFSSFLAKNILTFNQITPDLPVKNPWVFKEINSNLPFAPLIDSAIDRYAVEDLSKIIPSKTICYKSRSDIESYVFFRALDRGGNFDEPKVNHLYSKEFCLESYKELLTSGS